MTRVYWDTMLFIYLLEEHPEFAPRVAQMRIRQLERGDQLVTSVLTLGEMLVGPLKSGDTALAETIKSHMRSPDVESISVTPGVAVRFGEIRAAHKAIRPLDAIHLACAAESKVDLFVTNDDQLRKLTIPGIRFFCGLDGKLSY